MGRQVREYKADISFLQSVIDGYKIGIFNDKGLPIRVMNALESLSQYGQVPKYIEVPDLPPKLPHYKKYTKRSDYWNKKSAQPKATDSTNDSLMGEV